MTIRTTAEAQALAVDIEEQRARVAETRKRLGALKLEPEHIEQAIAPHTEAIATAVAELAAYQSVQDGKLPPVDGITGLGETLVNARLALGFNQTEFAQKLDVTQPTVARNEGNDVPYGTVSLQSLAAFYARLPVRVEIKVSWDPPRSIADLSQREVELLAQTRGSEDV